MRVLINDDDTYGSEEVKEVIFSVELPYVSETNYISYIYDRKHGQSARMKENLGLAWSQAHS